MAITFAEGEGGEEPSTSNPVKRMRWATQRVTGRKASTKRRSIFNRNAARQRDTEKNRESTATDPDLKTGEQDVQNGETDDDNAVGRSIYFNVALPPSARDEDGRPLQQFKRNKIRTAKYTPISFLPKNFWFQFHNIANIYFLAIIILDVCILLQRAGRD